MVIGKEQNSTHKIQYNSFNIVTAHDIDLKAGISILYMHGQIWYVYDIHGFLRYTDITFTGSICKLILWVPSFWNSGKVFLEHVSFKIIIMPHVPYYLRMTYSFPFLKGHY